MSRLDSFIRRVTAQRACLNRVAEHIADVSGIVLELGLGNGRTYDHLRELLPGREIYVFDRRVAAHPDCIPDEDHLFVGDVLKQLPVAASQLGRVAALAHSDIGTGVAERDAALASQLGPALAALVRPSGFVLSDQAFSVDGWEGCALPDGVEPGRYFIYRVAE